MEKCSLPAVRVAAAATAVSDGSTAVEDDDDAQRMGYVDDENEIESTVRCVSVTCNLSAEQQTAVQVFKKASDGILLEFIDGLCEQLPEGLPPVRGVDHRIELGLKAGSSSLSCSGRCLECIGEAPRYLLELGLSVVVILRIVLPFTCSLRKERVIQCFISDIPN